MTDLLLSWLTSYLLHSSLLLGAVWLVERLGGLRRLGAAGTEWLWRLALLGPLLSAALPVLPDLSLPTSSATPPVLAQTAPAPAPRELPVVTEPLRSVATSPTPTPAPAPLALALPRAELQLPLAEAVREWGGLALVLWLAGALGGLASLALRWLWLRATVARLPQVQQAPWPTWLAEESRRQGVPEPQLRRSARWASPLLAPGRVLCLPDWALTLPEAQARAVLGHELAHLQRHDPAWRLAAAALRAVLWLQPLNAVALKRLDLLAELACDAAAAQAPGRREALAESLLHCAQRLAAPRTRLPALACSIGSSGSPLVQRVRHLLAPDASELPVHRAARWLALAVGVAALVALPTIAVRHADAGALLDRLEMPGWFNLGGKGLRMTGSGPGSRFSAQVDGSVSFNDTETDVQSLQGRMRITERQGATTREMVLESQADGSIKRSFSLNSQPAELDDAGRAWWASAVARVAEVVVDPKVRVKNLFARSGLAGVMHDLARDRSDHALRRQIEAVADLGPALDDAAFDQLIAAADRLGSDFEHREALQHLAGRTAGLNDAQQIAWLNSVAAIGSDFESREALAALAPKLSRQPAVLAAWAQAVDHISGDFELRTALETLVSAQPDPAVLKVVLQATQRMGGDFERREALAAVARRLKGDETELVQAYTASAAQLDGDFEKREALIALLNCDKLQPAGLNGVLDAAQGIGSSFELLQVLERVVTRMPVDSALVARVRKAARGLADFERGQLEKHLDQREG